MLLNETTILGHVFKFRGKDILSQTERKLKAVGTQKRPAVKMKTNIKSITDSVLQSTSSRSS